jgi:predicted PurR-regulated permease PerM
LSFPQALSLAALIAAGLILWNLRQWLLLLFAAIVLALALCSLVDALQRRFPMRRSIALLASLSGLGLLLTVLMAVLVPPFVDEFALLLQKLPQAARALLQLGLHGLDQVSEALYGVDAMPDLEQLGLQSQSILPDTSTLASGVGSGLIGLLGLAGNLGSAGLSLLFVVAAALMVTVQPQAYRRVGILLVPSFYRRRANQILTLCGDALNSWMVGVGISSLAVFLLCGIALWLLGVKLVLANALLAGVLNVIPNVGPTMSTVFPMAVALLDAPWKAAAVLGAYVVIQNLESYVITPSVMHHQVKLLPGLTLAAQVLFTVVFGPLGLLMALPLAVVLQVLIGEVLIKDVLNRWTTLRLRP